MLSLSLLAGLVTVVTEPVAGPAPAAAATTTFAYTGSPQMYVVPANTTSLTVTVKGAGGGAPTGGGTAGSGGSVTATIAVTPGQVLQVNVGGAGTVTGGWNGGGSGFGGGASDIRTDSTTVTQPGCAYDFTCTLANRLIVAGGGGGAGSASGANGGAGGQTATAGVATNNGSADATAGGAAGSGAGGTAGAGTTTAASGVVASTAGASGVGGGAASGTAAAFLRGGGGGGGYYGGGGGGISAVATDTGAAGGGGGTSYAGGTGVSGASFADASNTGAGEITIDPANSLTGTVVFNYTGAYQVYSVPSNVELVRIRLYGASGGGAGTGAGDVVTGQFAVQPGGFIQINVGGMGTGFVDDGTGAASSSLSYKGGWNGGGDGMAASSGTAGAGGGGATDIRMCGTAVVGGCNVTERRVIAGGGGGDGASYTGTAGGGNADGSAANPSGAASGGGGSLANGGVGGLNSGVYGEDGGPGYGGESRPRTGTVTGGGGGGGGLYGGGGGNASVGGAGGGGSSCASILGACNAARNLLGVANSGWTHRQGGNSGNGYVVITPVSIARTAQDASTPANPVAASAVVATAATIHGAVNPMGLATQPQVFYATTSAGIDVPGTGTKVVLRETGGSSQIITGTSWVQVEGDLSGLTATTTYYYRVCAESVGGLSCGPIANFTTMAGAALPTVGDPTVQLLSITASAATFTGTVTNPGTGPTAAIFQCATDSAFTTGVVDGTATPATMTGTTPININGGCTGLAAGTAYYVRIKATNNGMVSGNIAYSANPATFTTVGTPTVGTPTLTAGSISASYMAFSGTVTNPGGGTSTATTAISWECATDAAFTTGLVTGAAAPSVATGTSSVNVTGNCSNLTDYTNYYFRLKAVNSAGTAVSAAVGPNQTLPIIVAPTISAAVTTSNITTSSADVAGTVDSPGHGPTSIFIDCSTTNNFTGGTTVSFPATPSTASGITSTPVTGSCVGLSTNTQYFTRLRAVNTAGTTTSPGVSGNPVTFTTLQGAYAPVVGTLALGSGTPVAETTADLTVDITDPGVGPTAVVFQCSTSPTFPATSATQTVNASTTPVSGTSAVNGLTATCGSGTALTPMTAYYARVKATNSAAPSGMFSNVVSFTTLAYAITPTVGAVTVVNGSVATTSASFTGAITNPGSGGSSSNWSTTTVSLQCATNAGFTTGVVAGTLTAPAGGVATGRNAVAVAGSCTGLTSNTTYYVRVNATSTITDPSDPNYGATQPYTVHSTNGTFTTPPVVLVPTVSTLVVATSPAITDNSASFTVSVNPNYGSTSVVFECSTTNNFASIAATVVGTPSPIVGSSAQTVAATCAPLAPSTTYFVRVTATNSAGATSTTTPSTVSATTLASITLPAVSNVSLTSVVSPAVNPDYTSALIEATVTSTGNGTADVELQCDSTPAFTNPTVVTAYTDSAMTTPATSLTGLSAIQVYGECASLTNNTTYYARARVWNSAGSDYSTSVFPFTTPATVITPTVAQLASATSAIDSSGSAPYTTTVASLTGSVTNPGSGNITGSWSNTAVGFECATNAGFTTGLVTGTVTSPVGGNVTGRTAATVTGSCAGLTPNTLYYARVTATNTPTGGSQTTVNGAALTFTTVNIVVPPVFSNATIPTPPAGTPTIPTVVSITTPGATPNTTEVAGVVDAGTTVTIKVNGVERMAGNPAAPTDLCTVTGTAYVCILDPDVTAGQTLTVISTDPTATPNPLSSHIDVLVPASGTTPGTMGAAQVVVGTPMVAERVTLSTTVNPGVGPTTITYVYSTNPVFGTSAFATVPNNQLLECVVSPALTGSSAAAVPPRQCVGLPNTVTTYWVRAKAVNSPTNGQSGLIPVWSNATMFTSTTRTWAPSAPLGVDVTATTFTSITLSAIVDPGNASTTVTYECSTDPAFNPLNDPNLVTVVSPQSPVSGSNVVPTTAVCTGLVAATQYYIRVSLVNSVNPLSPATATTSAMTLSTPAPSGGGGGGGGGVAAPAGPVLGSLAAVPPSPLLRPGAFTIMENGVPVGATSTATANGTQISTAGLAVTFRGLTPDRQAIPLGPEPDHALVLACNGFVQVQGNGFKGGYMGKLYLFDGSTLLADIPMNEAGGFNVTVPMPEGIGGADFNLQLNAYGMGLQTVSLTIGVKVDVCPPPPPVTIIGKKQVTTVQQVYFDEWSPELDAKAKDTLLKLIDQTSREPLKVKSIGFVQGKGTPQKGWELSQKRADNVLAFLTGKGRMNPKEAVARGENVDGNVNPNRMVQVTVVWHKRVQVQVPADQVPEGAEIVSPKDATTTAAGSTNARKSPVTKKKPVTKQAKAKQAAAKTASKKATAKAKKVTTSKNVTKKTAKTKAAAKHKASAKTKSNAAKAKSAKAKPTKKAAKHAAKAKPSRSAKTTS